ncbi:MAG: RNA 2',3'-cyclic phosphodiesterase [Candidatus Omnitrophica bacterium CG07_land_8_20_14_0_80_42_15]|uniref:RNA 2',3'-cyclic phosphodiesterase n=1 Tax=Candidatus Aquitaenariimonas noxiae TaxID=1974741 RepID=A0A2J0L219_9BACT|nr:MAG: RNA 2',3'-cyclic phosphodiesterase [Candidatus Omnitrophica bacterium CG07_land_8_20_14_0_80_42_15]
MEEQTRSFIAIELCSDIKEELASLIEKLKSSGADVKWVEPLNIHLTLKFLGGMSLDEIDTIKNVMDKTKNKFKAFQMSLSQVGAFPKLSYPRVIWVGVNDGKEKAKEIYDFLESELEKEFFEKEERPFSPHLTIGRVKSLKNKEALKSSIENLKFSSAKTSLVDHVTLFKSTLTPKGSIYTPIHVVKFTI